MIGLFEITDKRDGETYILAKSKMENKFIGRFYIPPLYRSSCSNLSNGDIVFCIMDDDSGYGAVLYKVDDNITDKNGIILTNNLTVNKELNIQQDAQFNGNIDAKINISVNGNLNVGNTIKGKNLNATLNLTAAHCALIVASATSGSPAVLTGVQLYMN